MNKEVRELRKAGSIAGIEVSWFGEVISNKTRKFYNSLNKAKGCNLEVFNKVIKEAKKFNISNVTILKCNEKDHGYSSPNDFYNYLNPYSNYEDSEGSPE